MSEEKKNGLDLKDLQTSEDQQATMVAEHPVTFAELDIKITLAGPDSKVHKKATRKIRARILKQVGKSRVKDLTPEEMDKVNMNTAVACTLDWEEVEFDGQVLECTPENVEFIYKKVGWLYDQVQEFINERSNFLGK